MQRPAGLILRGGVWHIQRTVTLGAAKRRIRETTRFREEEVDEAKRHLEQRIYDVKTELRQGPTQPRLQCDGPVGAQRSARQRVRVRVSKAASRQEWQPGAHREAEQPWIPDGKGQGGPPDPVA